MNEFSLSAVFAAKPEDIYQAWLSSEGHTAMTGSPAVVDGRVGGEFSAWDGYIFGKTLALSLNQRIAQAWRTSEFPDGTTDSLLEVDLKVLPREQKSRSRIATCLQIKSTPIGRAGRTFISSR